MEQTQAFEFQHIAIEGVFKSGKTRLAGLLAQRLGGKVVYDKTENPYLKDFYDEKEGAAFLSQLVFLVNRYHQQVRLFQRDLFEERIICDYIFEKDKIYAYQTLSDDELVVYEKIYGVFAERVPKPDLVIYLQISLPTLIRRIAREGSALEKNISEKYLQDLIEAFDYFFFNYQATPLLVIKSDELDLAREADLEDIIDQIRQMKKALLILCPAELCRERRRQEMSPVGERLRKQTLPQSRDQRRDGEKGTSHAKTKIPKGHDSFAPGHERGRGKDHGADRLRLSDRPRSSMTPGSTSSWSAIRWGWSFSATRTPSP